MFAINVLGPALPRLVRSTILLPTGRKGTSTVTSSRQAASFRQTATKAMGSSIGARRFREAACWAHWRRDFHDIWISNESEIAREALDRIGALYDIERDIAGQPADIHLVARVKVKSPQ
ncbi:hypothetical protein ACVIOG_005923 [Rhizobium leguminosarum]